MEYADLNERDGNLPRGGKGGLWGGTNQVGIKGPSPTNRCIQQAATEKKGTKEGYFSFGCALGRADGRTMASHYANGTSDAGTGEGSKARVFEVTKSFPFLCLFLPNPFNKKNKRKQEGRKEREGKAVNGRGGGEEWR